MSMIRLYSYLFEYTLLISGTYVHTYNLCVTFVECLTNSNPSLRQANVIKFDKKKNSFIQLIELNEN